MALLTNHISPCDGEGKLGLDGMSLKPCSMGGKRDSVTLRSHFTKRKISLKKC